MGLKRGTTYLYICRSNINVDGQYHCHIYGCFCTVYSHQADVVGLLKGSNARANKNPQFMRDPAKWAPLEIRVMKTTCK